jgi:hypothetical protein
MLLVDEGSTTPTASADPTFSVRVRRDPFGGDSAARPEEPVWQLSVESDPSWVGSEAFVASFLSWVDAVEALHRVAEQMEQVDDRSTAGTTPADVADMLSIRRHTP